MKKSFLLLFVMGLMWCSGALAATSIVNLRTEYLDTPVGIDVPQPRLSWQMNSDHIGAAQTAFRVLVADTEDKLKSGNYVFDSGKNTSDQSLNVLYRGKVLKPSTRYFWKVQVWDEKGALVESAPSWFETGLMGSGWSRAQWIGTDEVSVSKYRTFFIVDFDLVIPQGNNRAVFVYSAKDNQNFISTEVNIAGEKSLFIVRHTVGGVESEDAVFDVSDIITPANKNQLHKIRLDVSTPGYHLRSILNPSIDGMPLRNRVVAESAAPAAGGRTGGGAAGGTVTINPYPGGEYITDYARLHSIGFRQPEGQKAIFSNITLSEKNWKTTLYVDPTPVHEVTGTGALTVWEPYGLNSAPMLRKTIQVAKPLKSAKLYVTARGIYEFYINGARVSNDYFNPGWTDYRYRIMYNSYDVTSMMKQGANGLGAMLGSGWFSDLNIFTSSNVDPYGIRQSLMAKVLITYEDGTTQIVVTDGSWKRYDTGPVTRNGFQFGEDYDARKEVDNWTMGNFDDSQWKNVVIFDRPAPTTQIQAYVGLPIQNNITLTAISVTEPIKGTYVYDLGQNIVGVPRLEGMKGKSGQVINLRYGEMVYPDIIPTNPVPPYTIETYQKMKGQVYVENYRGAISIDNYIMRGKPAGETYQPIFTDHGFRYISVTGLTAPLPISQVKGVVLESIGHATSLYESSNPLINRLFQNILWGQRGNFQAVPTDCPQRDERQGWTGDAQVFARAATYFSPWVGQFYDRWLYSMRDNQHLDGSYFNYYPVTGQPPYGYSPESSAGWMGWMDAGIIVPWQVYQQYGDVGILESHYNSMVRYMNYLEQRVDGAFIQLNSGIGDHLAIETTNIGLTNTAYYAYDAYMMSRIAQALGKKEDQQKYATLYENIKKAFNEKYVNDEGVTVAEQAARGMGGFGGGFGGGAPQGAGAGAARPAAGQAPATPAAPAAPAAPTTPPAPTVRPVDTQTSYVVPLQADLFDDKHKALAVENLVKDIREHNNTLTTGFIGTPYLNPMLSENGYSDVAYTLFQQEAYPSWLYPVKQGGTTMWERWNSYTIERGFGPVDMNSFNHYAYGAIGEWMFAHSLGIQRDENRPGYKHIILQPAIDFKGELKFAKGYFESPYGKISSGWEKTANGYVYRVTIPGNTTASLNLVAPSVKNVTVLTGKEGVGRMSFAEGKVKAELKSGTYEFEVKN